MNQEKTRNFYQIALNYVARHQSEELEWVRNLSAQTFSEMSPQRFLYQYCWVVYASGFRVSILEKKFEALQKAFQGFDIEKIYTMESVAEALKVINNKRKANCFLQGVRSIYEEGFTEFQERVLQEGMPALKALPGIGDITQKHLARNIGLVDISKDDIWLVRLADKLGANNVEELVVYLANEFEEKQGIIDLVLWRFCADNGWQRLDCDTLDELLVGLDSEEIRMKPKNIQIIAHTFTAVVHKEDDLYVAHCPEVDTISQGETIEEAIANLKEATELYLEEFPVPQIDRPILTTFDATVYA